MIVDGAVLDAIVRHAREAAPDECCGLLIGRGDRIEEAVWTRNTKASPSAYEVDPADRQILGAYHSHPRSEAAPSPRDIAESHDEALVHVIVSLAGGEPRIAAFRIRKGGADTVPLDIRRSAG
jgi:proteasome lid subunit RPN8/RPN11